MVTPRSRSSAHQLPHVAAQLHVDAGGGLVEEQDLRLVRQCLGDQHAPLHAAGEGDDLVVALLPQREVAQGPLDDGRRGRLAEQAAGERDRGPDGLEGARGELLGDEADHAARGAEVAADVVPGDGDRARRRGDGPADDADQRGLAGTVGPEQAEDLAALGSRGRRASGPAGRRRRSCSGADRDDGGHAADGAIVWPRACAPNTRRGLGAPVRGSFVRWACLADAGKVLADGRFQTGLPHWPNSGCPRCRSRRA